MAIINKIFKINMFGFGRTSEDFYTGVFRFKIYDKCIFIYDVINQQIPCFSYRIGYTKYNFGGLNFLLIKKQLMHLNHERCIYYYKYGRRAIKDLNKNSPMNDVTDIYRESGSSLLNEMAEIINKEFYNKYYYINKLIED
jgi:hypothetical protein